MKPLRIVGAITLLLAAQTAFALTTMGDRSCGDWINRHSNAFSEVGDQSWLSGIMTGLAIGTNADILADTDGQSMQLWMDNYCRAHPLDKVGTGAMALALELANRMPKH